MRFSAALLRLAGKTSRYPSTSSSLLRNGGSQFRTVSELPPSSVADRMSAMTMTRRWLRREPISQAQVQAEMEEEARNVDLAPHKLLQKGDPGTVQAVIRDTLPVGYWVTMPSGKEAYLPAQDLGFTGGLAILERLFKVGQEITVRVASIGGGGREILSIKKPEFAPPERKFSVSANTAANRSHGSRY
jgi:hypothetical protein